jgi:hypothetical protein
MDLTKQENVVALMRSSKSERDCYTNCDKVKAANGGYPSWWFATIRESGLRATTEAQFKE